MKKQFGSGRFLVLLFTVGTYCLCILGITYMTAIKIISPEVFLALFAGLSGIVAQIVSSYFHRTDRANGSVEPDKSKGV